MRQKKIQRETEGRHIVDKNEKVKNAKNIANRAKGEKEGNYTKSGIVFKATSCVPKENQNNCRYDLTKQVDAFWKGASVYP